MCVTVIRVLGVAVEDVFGDGGAVEDTILPGPRRHPSLQPAPSPVRLVWLAVYVHLRHLIWGRLPQLSVQFKRPRAHVSNLHTIIPRSQFQQGILHCTVQAGLPTPV